MKSACCCASVVVLFFLILSPAISQETESGTQPPKKAAANNYRPADQNTIELIKKMAIPFLHEEHRTLRTKRLGPVVDYSPLVKLVRDQGVTQSCCVQATAAIVDILKERERPFTPNVSEGFINYAYQVSIGWYPRDNRIRIPGDGQAGVVKNLGACPEACLSSRNYDPAHLGSTPSQAEIPKNSDIAEAHLLRIKDHKVLTFKKEDGLTPIKALLASGPLGVLYNAHCMVLIGYDDAKAQFTFQNSWGEHGSDRGFVKWTYDEMLNRLPNMWVTVINNAPTPPNVYPYTARIHLGTPRGRDNLSVKIGVEGQPAFTVWAPSPYGATDGGEELLMDVPLPAYAGRHWPPSGRNLWYLEASYPGQVGGVVRDVVLVKRGFRPDASFLPELHRASSTNFQIRPNAPEKVFIPPRSQDRLILSPNQGTVHAGQKVILKGTLLKNVSSSSTKIAVIPISNQRVEICAVRSDPVEGTITEGVICTATTDTAGKYQGDYLPRSTGRYQARAAKPDGKMIATSNVVEIRVQ
jgi:hypothetical protein